METASISENGAAAAREPMQHVCAYCGEPFLRIRSQGAPQRFCAPKHRHEFHQLTRAWGELQFALGRVTGT
jgi:hypothetical protein